MIHHGKMSLNAERTEVTLTNEHLATPMLFDKEELRQFVEALSMLLGKMK